MARINLLAGDLAPRANIIRIANALKSVSVVGLVIFVIIITGILSLFVINRARLAASSKRQEVFKESIGKMAQTEQQFYLLRNRLVFFKEVDSVKTAGKQIADLQKINSSLPVGSLITEVSLNGTQIEFVITADSSSALSTALRQTMASSTYSTLRLDSYTFSQSAGYGAALRFLQ